MSSSFGTFLTIATFVSTLGHILLAVAAIVWALLVRKQRQAVSTLVMIGAIMQLGGMLVGFVGSVAASWFSVEHFLLFYGITTLFSGSMSLLGVGCYIYAALGTRSQIKDEPPQVDGSPVRQDANPYQTQA